MHSYSVHKLVPSTVLGFRIVTKSRITPNMLNMIAGCLFPAFRKFIRLKNPVWMFFPGSGSLRDHHHHSERVTLCQEGTVTWECSKANVNIVKNIYLPTKNVSKRWAMHPMLPPGVIMKNSPCSWHQTHSRACYDPSDGPQMAISSNPLQSLERLCYHCSERAKPCQDGTVI